MTATEIVMGILFYYFLPSDKAHLTFGDYIIVVMA